MNKIITFCQTKISKDVACLRNVLLRQKAKMELINFENRFKTSSYAQ